VTSWIRKQFGSHNQVHGQICIDNLLGCTFNWIGKPSPIGAEYSRASSTRGGHEHAAAGSHLVDAALPENCGAMKDKAL
jgi:hypothetical protein